jgi:uncharacterized protein (DUF2164 family)
VTFIVGLLQGVGRILLLIQGYDGIYALLGLEHLTINHTVEFVSQETGAYMKNRALPQVIHLLSVKLSDLYQLQKEINGVFLLIFGIASKGVQIQIAR